MYADLLVENQYKFSTDFWNLTYLVGYEGYLDSTLRTGRAAWPWRESAPRNSIEAVQLCSKVVLFLEHVTYRKESVVPFDRHVIHEWEHKGSSQPIDHLDGMYGIAQH